MANKPGWRSIKVTTESPRTLRRTIMIGECIVRCVLDGTKGTITTSQELSDEALDKVYKFFRVAPVPRDNTAALAARSNKRNQRLQRMRRNRTKSTDGSREKHKARAQRGADSPEQPEESDENNVTNDDE